MTGLLPVLVPFAGVAFGLRAMYGMAVSARAREWEALAGWSALLVLSSLVLLAADAAAA